MHQSTELTDFGEVEWLAFDDSESDERVREWERVENAIFSCLSGENSLQNVFGHVSNLDCYDKEMICEVIVDLVLSCCFHDFYETRQIALVRAIAADLEAVSRKNNRRLHIDPDDLNLSFHPDNSKSTRECVVTLKIIRESIDSAKLVLDFLEGYLTFKDADSGRKRWPSLVGRIQEELLGRDGSDWDPSNVPFTVSIESTAYVRRIQNDFLAFSAMDRTFRPRPKPVDRLLVLGGREPHKNDFTTWAAGLPGISAKACHPNLKDQDKMHTFSVLASCDNPRNFR